MKKYKCLIILLYLLVFSGYLQYLYYEPDQTSIEEKNNTTNNNEWPRAFFLLERPGNRSDDQGDYNADKAEALLHHGDEVAAEPDEAFKTTALFIFISISILFVLGCCCYRICKRDVSKYIKVCYIIAILGIGYIFISSEVSKYMWINIATWNYISPALIAMIIIYNLHITFEFFDIKKKLNDIHIIELKIEDLCLILVFITSIMAIIIYCCPKKETLWEMTDPTNSYQIIAFFLYCWFTYILYFAFVFVISINIWINTQIILNVRNKLKNTEINCYNDFDQIDIIKTLTEMLINTSYYEILLVVVLFIYTLSYIISERIFLIRLNADLINQHSQSFANLTNLHSQSFIDTPPELVGLDKSLLILILIVCIIINYLTINKIKALIEDFEEHHASHEILNYVNMSKLKNLLESNWAHIVRLLSMASIILQIAIFFFTIYNKS